MTDTKRLYDVYILCKRGKSLPKMRLKKFGCCDSELLGIFLFVVETTTEVLTLHLDMSFSFYDEFHINFLN